eukprot:TRINITY_DN12107_c0_g1_i1.p1 TRINITY_DN12107_c0_g1~~TRINITY_DN12107_c0_g1_i1.p1  ORF type:complete len:225 (+),score=8.71 TRINITY_DN12107_c0_g1_i1:507-1181(+)
MQSQRGADLSADTSDPSDMLQVQVSLEGKLRREGVGPSIPQDATMQTDPPGSTVSTNPPATPVVAPVNGVPEAPSTCTPIRTSGEMAAPPLASAGCGRLPGSEGRAQEKGVLHSRHLALTPGGEGQDLVKQHKKWRHRLYPWRMEQTPRKGPRLSLGSSSVGLRDEQDTPQRVGMFGNRGLLLSTRPELSFSSIDTSLDLLDVVMRAGVTLPLPSTRSKHRSQF